jgi:trigger factor
MQFTTEKQPGCLFCINYTFDYNEFMPSVIRLARSIRLPGFRPGHVPISAIDSVYGENAAYLEICRDMVGEEWKNIVKDAGLEAIADVYITMDKVVKNQPIVFHYNVYTRNELELGDYKGLKIFAPKTEVTDEMVEERIQEALRKQVSRTPVTDRPCQNGDLVSVDYTGSIDGEAVESLSFKNRTIKLGEGWTFTDLESQIVGMSIGEERDCFCHLPDDYSDEKLKGKDVSFHVTLTGITEEKLPELDDDFVQDVSEFDTVEQYREDIRRMLKLQSEDDDKAALQSRLLSAVYSNSKVDISMLLARRVAHQMFMNQMDQFTQQGFDYTKFLKTDEDRERMIDNYMTPAYNDLATYELEHAIIDAENIEVTDEDMDAFFARQREILGDDRFEEAMAALDDAKREEIKSQIEIDKMFDILEKNAEITYVAPDDPRLNLKKEEAEDAAAETAEDTSAEDGKE